MLRIALNRKSTLISANTLSTTTSSSKIVACFAYRDFLFRDRYVYLTD